jgi:SH3-like domain-containing protein
MKNWYAALGMMIAQLLLLLLPSGIAAASVLSGMEIVTGDRGTILFLKSDSVIDCNASNPSAAAITIVLSGCIYGLQDFSYTKFDKKSPVTSLIASEKKQGSIVKLQITMKDPVDEQPVLKRKNTDIYILLSKKPREPFTWKAPAAFETNQKLAVIEAKEKQNVQHSANSTNGMVNKNEDRAVTLLTDIAMVYREQICRINFQFNGSVKGTIVRNQDSVVCSFKGVKSGLEKSIFEIHPRSVYKKIIISEKKGNENVLIAKIVVDTSEAIGQACIVFEDSRYFTIMTINKSSYNAFWSTHPESNWEHELTYVKPYEIDFKKMGERAERDVALNLSSGPVFRVGDFFSESPAGETIRNGITAAPIAEKFSETTPDVAMHTSEKQSVPESTVTSQIKPEVYDSVVINSNDVNIRKQPSVTSVAITKAMKGMSVQRISSNNGWTRIAINGTYGWINNKFVDQPSQVAIAEKENVTAEVQVVDSKIGDSMELKPQFQSLSNDSMAIQKVSQQIGVEDTFKDEKNEADLVIRYHQKGRDPFAPLFRDSLMQGGKASIDQLQLVGVLIDGNDKVALFEDKSSKKQSFTLRENDAVENGKVLKVFPDRVVFLLTEFGISRSFTLRLKGINTDEEARVR